MATMIFTYYGYVLIGSYWGKRCWVFKVGRLPPEERNSCNKLCCIKLMDVVDLNAQNERSLRFRLVVLDFFGMLQMVWIWP